MSESRFAEAADRRQGVLAMLVAFFGVVIGVNMS